MKILITGNMGYVGPCLVQHLRTTRPGATLIGFDMGYFARILTNADILPECRVDVQRFGDVRKPPSDLLDDVDAVIHLAAISNDPMGNRFEDVTLAINHRATLDLAARAKAAGVASFVFASSCSVYGISGDSARTEKSEVNPLTAYARSKVYAEEGLARLASDGFRVTSLRFATACGMSDRLRLDLVLNDFVAAAVASRRIRILSDGSPWRPLIHVRDMARAMDWAIDRRWEQGSSFLAVNVGRDDWNYRVGDLASAIERIIPGVTIDVSRDAQPDRRSYRVSFELFRSLAPTHQPGKDLLTTVSELEDGLRSIGFRDEDFRSSLLIRLNALDDLRKRGLLDNELGWVVPEPLGGA